MEERGFRRRGKGVTEENDAGAKEGLAGAEEGGVAGEDHRIPMQVLDVSM